MAALVVVAVTSLGLSTVAQAVTVPPADPNVPSSAKVDTEVNITSTGNPPSIECAWALPDMSSTDTATPAIQYTNAFGDSDDDVPQKTTSPCDLPGGGLHPTQPNGATHTVQVRPNPEDQPEARRIELWAAVDGPNGDVGSITGVFFKVFHPDGSFKLEVDPPQVGQPMDPGVTRPVSRYAPNVPVDPKCAGPAGMFAAAGPQTTPNPGATGQLTDKAINQTTPDQGIVALCRQGVKALYTGEFQVSKHQPCGPYKVEVHALNNGAEDVQTYYLDIICFFSLAIDFNAINWGTVTSTSNPVVGGDLNFQPATSTAPTIKNVGNSGMGLSLTFTAMTIPGQAGSKTINRFDAKFGRSAATLQTLDPIIAGQPASGVFDTDRERTLCSNELGKLDVSLHPDSFVSPGHYEGDMFVIGRSQPICPTDQLTAG